MIPKTLSRILLFLNFEYWLRKWIWESIVFTKWIRGSNVNNCVHKVDERNVVNNCGWGKVLSTTVYLSIVNNCVRNVDEGKYCQQLHTKVLSTTVYTKWMRESSVQLDCTVIYPKNTCRKIQCESNWNIFIYNIYHTMLFINHKCTCLINLPCTYWQVSTLPK